MAKEPITITVNGLEVSVTKTKVMIMDELDDVSETEATLIVQYLYDEGFIKKKNIVCQIIKPND